MDTRTIRDVHILLPGEQPEDLEPADVFPSDRTTLSERRIEAGAWVRAKIHKCTITRSWFLNADLASLTLTETTLDRCVLEGCSLVGAHLTNCTLKNVIFENCRFDYASLTGLRTAGPVAFAGCSLAETDVNRCKLNDVVFDGCKFHATTFTVCDLRGADLRGNDLSRVVGIIGSFRGVILSATQLAGLTEAVTSELDLRVKND